MSGEMAIALIGLFHVQIQEFIITEYFKKEVDDDLSILQKSYRNLIGSGYKICYRILQETYKCVIGSYKINSRFLQ